MDANGPLRLEGDDLIVIVRATPRAPRDEIAGVKAMSDGREVVQARVRAVPEDGAANAAIAALVAKAAGMPKSAGNVTAGQTSRVKTVRVTGAGKPGLDALSRLCGL
ncbi:hypothetical protein HDIA_3711 [Hartmannibacter diazotrophicus]|uniref:UPF0235 protein HDIA_3711 n=1 Tax=Hartmannibacter diazotrophicus TaxID=1482074 RepID=A0A2C9DAA1_9HYPH|nr:DUF167 family protein [Hartmannibacter diazotrophicus]SON57252.1 hypothetical protein HDIA_3711 [Hartmannibacter diazotrophicus]